MNDTNNSIVATKLEWHKGPALGGTGTAGPDTWFDDDELLVIGGECECGGYLISVENPEEHK